MRVSNHHFLLSFNSIWVNISTSKFKTRHLIFFLKCFILVLLLNAKGKAQDINLTASTTQICNGSSVTFTANANGFPPYQPYQYIWQVSHDGGNNFSDISGQNQSTYTSNSLLHGDRVVVHAIYFREYFINDEMVFENRDIFSNEIEVQVNSSPKADINTISTATSGSIKFNGSDQYLSLSNPTSIGAGAFTIDGWFRLDAPPSNYFAPIIGSELTNSLSVFIKSDLTSISVNAYGDHTDDFTFPTISIGVWHHLAVVRNSSGGLTVFLDGQRSISGTITQSFSFSTTYFDVGKLQNNFLSGYLSNLRVVTGSNLYDPTQNTISVPTSLTTAVTNTKLLLNAVSASSLLTDGSGTQTSITNNNGATWSGGTPFLVNLNSSSNATISNATVDGVWSSSNNSILEVNSSGELTPIATGNATITYTVTSTTPFTCVSTESSLFSTTLTTACINPTNGGTIASAQSGSSGFNPAAFTSSAAPTGHNGTLEYKWQSSTTSSTTGFSDIASSNSDIYDAGALTQTTWFKRLARVNCSSDWSGAAESNVLQICITPANPVVTNASRCGAGTVTLSATSAAGTVIDWSSGVRYIRYSCTYSNDYGQANLSELQAYKNGVNIALNKPVSTNSDYSNTRIYVNDGITNTRWSSNRNNPGYASVSNPHYIVVDLEDNYIVDNINLFGDNGSCDYILSVSVDANSWFSIGQGTLSNTPITYRMSDISITPLLTASNTFTTPSISATTTYYVVARDAVTGCVSASTTAVTATVNPLPVAPAGTNGARCSTGTVSISATPGSGETIDWYDASSGGSVLTNGSGVTSFTTPSISTTTTYYAEARNTTTGCVSATRTAVTATVNALPAAPAGTNGARCSYGTVSISATPGTDEVIDWYEVSTGGSVLTSGSGVSSYTTPGISATTIYYAVARNTTTGCISASRTAVTATVNVLPSRPSRTSGTRCGTGTVSISATSGSGETIDWYAASSGGSVLTNGSGVTSFTTPSISATTTYYAEARNTTTGCVSNTRINVTAAVNALPDTPSGTNGTRCSTGTVSISASRSGLGGPAELAIDWYASSSGGSVLTNGYDVTSFTTPSISTTTIYYAEQRTKLTGCVSATRTAVTATVNALPAAPTGTNGARCSTGTVSLSATPGSGETIYWFTSSNSPIPSASGLSYTTPSISTTTIYYAEARNNTTGCISASRTAVTATVNALPATPSGTNGTRCSTGTVSISATPGTDEVIDWYDASSGGSVLTNGSGVTSFTTPSISTTTIYYAEARNTTTGCVSATRTAVTATLDAQVTTATAGADQALCNTSTFTLNGNSPTSGTGAWSFVGSSGTASISSSSSRTSTVSSVPSSTVITLRWTITNGTCSSTDDVIIRNNPLPDATISASGATTFTYGNSVVLSGPPFVLPSVVESVGNALTLNGTSNYVSIPSGINNNFSGNQITVEGWFYPTQQSFNTTALISEAYEGDGVVKFVLSSEFESGVQKIKAGFYSPSTAWVQGTSSVNLSYNQWTHIAATYDQANIKIYINGSLTCTYANTNALPNGSERWLLGKKWDGTQYCFFPGTMDEVRIWNMARTQAQIQFSMNNRISSTTSGLVGYYKLDESSGTTATDATGHGYDGTVN